MLVTPESVEQFPSSYDAQLQNDFYRELGSLPSVDARRFPLGMTWWASSGEAMLATRDTIDDFGVTQMLHGILRVGTHNYGIAQASGPEIKEDGQPYIIGLNDIHTYTGRPDFIAPLIPGLKVMIKDPMPAPKAVPEDVKTIGIGMDEQGEITISVPKHRYRLAEWITAKNAMITHDGCYNPLHQEINSWALPPRFLISSLKHTDTLQRQILSANSNTRRAARRARQVRLFVAEHQFRLAA